LENGFGFDFDGKQPPTITAELAELGFHWNNHRQVWQHPCGQALSGANYDRAAVMVRISLPTKSSLKEFAP